MNPDYFSKESIKNRMFKRAAELWEIRNIDHLDPIIKLMIESLASEIFQLSGEVNNMENRILEKVARFLTPSSLLSARPAHAIMHARAIYGTCDLMVDQAFHYKNAHFMKRHNLKRLSFTPVYTARVVNGDVAYLVGADGCWAMDSRLSKDLVARCTQTDPITNQNMWIGLDLAPEVKSLKDISFYFDFPYIENKEDYYRLLPHVKWYLGDHALAFKNGFFLCDEDEDDYASRLLEKYNANNQVNSDILNIYNHRFMHVVDDQTLSEKHRSLFPQELSHLFAQEALDGFDKPLVWLKASFPAGFSAEVLQGLTININAFPVANKYIHKSERKVNEISGVIPLIKETNEYFLGIDAVSDMHGNVYHEQKYGIDNKDVDQHIYSLRRGGCERFNSANAREYLDRLIDLLRDESMAFTNVEKDTLGENASDLLKQLNHLENKINLSGINAESISYIIFNDTFFEPTSFFVTYWLSNGVIGNGIKASELLGFTDMSDVDRSSSILLTTSRGGKEAPDSSGMLEMYKLALTSHGAIYSKQDVKSFCAIHCGDLVSDISVQSGYAVSKMPGEGIIRTIDVCLKPSASMNHTKLSEIKEDLLVALHANSPQEFNYQLIIQQN